jgi:DegV family protein with EDD domain
MLRIAMDSAGDLPTKWAEQYNIDIIPINIHFGEQTFLQGVDLLNRDFYRLVEESGVIPKTSQPTPQQFIDFYNRIAQFGDTIISVHVTGKLSGTYDSAQIAAREIKTEFNVIPIDSRSGSAAQGYMCRDARLMERDGHTIEEIVERLKEISRDVSIYFSLDTLDYARMSGRVRALQAALASILNIKPTVLLRDGILEIDKKVRSRRRSLNLVLQSTIKRWGDRLLNVAVVHAEDPKAGETLFNMVKKNLNCMDLIMTELSTSLTANLGPGTVGIIAYPVESE